MPGGNGIKMDSEAVEALKTLAGALPEATEMVQQAKENLESSFEEKKDCLGPHTSDIQTILETVSEAQAQGHSSVVKLQAKLVQAAAALQAIIDKGITVK